MIHKIVSGKKALRKSFHIFLLVSMLFSISPGQPVLAANYIDEFTPAPPGSNTPATIVETGTATTGMRYTFTSEGDGGDLLVFTFNGDENLEPRSTIGNESTIETITIETRDGTAFDFNSIYIDINSSTYGTGFTITGIGPEPFTINTTAPGTTGTYSPSGGSKLVNQVVISSVDFYDDFIDTVDVNIDVPGMEIEGNSTLIINGDSTPSTTDATDLGSTPTGTPVSSTFTINSIGDAALTLSGTPYVTLTGSSDFSITSQPSSGSITPGSSDTFTVQCNPTAVGSRTATVSITNNSEASPYTFDVQCTGDSDLTPPTFLTITRQNPSTSPTNADSLVFQASFDEAVQYVSTADFTVSGTSTASVTSVSSISSSVYNITVSGGNLASYNGVVGLDLSGSQNIADLSDNALPSGEPATDETYTLDNAGPTVTINQAVGQSDPATSGPINFTVEFDESVSDFATGDVTLSGTAGATTATITGSGTTYNVAVSGMNVDGSVIASIPAGVATDPLGNTNPISTSTDNQVTFNGDPEIDIQRPAGTSIPDGSTDNIGSYSIGTVNITYTITNSTGTDNLSITAVNAVNPTNVTGFTLNTATPITIASGDTGTFDISFNVPSAGAFGFDMDITNNDTDENNYDIAITGTGYIEPEIAVSYNGTNISDGDNTPSTTDGTDFGQDLISYLPQSPEHTFTITNNGAGPLLLTNSPRINLTGTGFSLITDAPASIASGASATFVVRFAATSVGASTGTITIDNNDTDENPFNFSITGTGYSGPLMIVQGGGPAQDISTGDSTPSIADDTEFQAALVAGGTVDHTFTIQNVGSSALSLTGTPAVSISGTHASDFSVTSQPGSNIASGSTDTFTIRFNPIAIGNRMATVTIYNDDPNNNPYTFTIEGQGDEVSVTSSGGTFPTDGAVLTSNPNNLSVQFSRDVLADGSTGAANYTGNYMLVEAGVNSTFDTVSCAGGVVSDDTQLTITSISYNSLSYIATLSVNSADFVNGGNYRLYVCGTTSVEDIYGNELNGGTSDTIIGFTISQSTGGGAAAVTLPATGFPVGNITNLTTQPLDKLYSNAGMILEIPSLELTLPIVGIPLVDGVWDVSWLTNEAGYLYGTAYPTWKGNTVITGHVWNAYNEPGPFSNLKDLHFGNLIKIQSGKNTYVYEVHDTRLYKANSINAVISHEEIDWLTLVTCEGYQESNQTYAYRRVIRAVLIRVLPD